MQGRRRKGWPRSRVRARRGRRRRSRPSRRMIERRSTLGGRSRRARHDLVEGFTLARPTGQLVACLAAAATAASGATRPADGAQMPWRAKACDARTDGPRDRVCAAPALLPPPPGLLPPTTCSSSSASLEFLEDEVDRRPDRSAPTTAATSARSARRRSTLPSAGQDALAPPSTANDQAAASGRPWAAPSLLGRDRRQGAASASGEAACKAASRGLQGPTTAIQRPRMRASPPAGGGVLHGPRACAPRFAHGRGVAPSRGCAATPRRSRRSRLLDARSRECSRRRPPRRRDGSGAARRAARRGSPARGRCVRARDTAGARARRCARHRLRLASAAPARRGRSARARADARRRRGQRRSSVVRTRIAKEAACMYFIR